MLGTLDSGRLVIEELHRFPNTPVREREALYWDTERLWQEIRRGIAITAEKGVVPGGIGVDTWGVDYGLIGADGELVERPRHYRDPRTNGIMERLFAVVPRDQVFGYTGLQFMQFNTLFQLFAERQANAPALGAAKHILNMPDLFNFWLTGEAKSEITIASTTQFFNPETMTWATELLKRLDLPGEILPPLVEPGTPLGKARDLPAATVYATAGHDTASAVAAVPAEGGDDWCYISSGTWSLMGLEIPKPIISPQTLALNFTNEVGVNRTIRLLKNIAGLWLLQECRRAWAEAGHEYNYEQLTRMAGEARPFSAAIDPDAFLEPGGMPEKIAAYCRAKHQEPPATHGEYARAILESLAFRYRHVLESLETLGSQKVRVIHIVGGGSRNAVLNQFVADCTGRRVIAGPSEATAIGNLLVLAIGAGELDGLGGLRAVVRNSFAPVVYDPCPGALWDRAYERYRKMVG